MTANLKIRNIRARAVLAPFKRPPATASGGIQSAALVLIDLETDGGITGRSYVFGFAPWTLKPIVGCIEAMLEMIKGDALAPVEIEGKLRKRLTLMDTPGLVGLALAGIDMAAWDAGAGERHATGQTLARSQADTRLQQQGPLGAAGGEAGRRGRGPLAKASLRNPARRDYFSQTRRRSVR